jgi:hypothetical protein
VISLKWSDYLAVAYKTERASSPTSEPAPDRAPMFMFHKFLASIPTNGRLSRDLGSHKNAEIKNPLEFFSLVMPSVIVANRARRKVVADYVCAARGMRPNVVRPPLIAFLDLPAGDPGRTVTYELKQRLIAKPPLRKQKTISAIVPHLSGTR